MSGKKKLLLATNHSYMFYRFRKELAARLQEEYEVILSSPYNGHQDDFEAMGVPVREIELSRRSINPISDLKLIQEYRKLLDEIRPDLVITYSIKPNVYLSRVCAARHIPYFSHIQGLGTAFQKPVLSSVAAFLYKQGLKNSSGVFFENQSSLDFFVSSGLADPLRTVLLMGAGVNTEEYPYTEPEEKETFHILYLGRIMKEKGMDELLDALEELHNEGYPFQFDFAGFCEEEYQERLDQTCSQGWGKNHGFVQNPIPLYQMADVIVLPSWHEGMSNVLLEAACIGRPLIATRIPGCQESIEDGITGYLCKKQNKDSLKEAMKKMLQLSFEERREMGRLGHEKMVREFSREQVVEKTVSEIRRRLNEQNPG